MCRSECEGGLSLRGGGKEGSVSVSQMCGSRVDTEGPRMEALQRVQTVKGQDRILRGRSTERTTCMQRVPVERNCLTEKSTIRSEMHKEVSRKCGPHGRVQSISILLWISECDERKVVLAACIEGLPS